MGQRHQAFIIARIIPHGGNKPQYRCIAAFHHQWCYGRLPLHATRRLLTLVKQKSNAEIILAEIQSIHGKYGTGGEKPNIPDVPCPYTALLLATGWSVDLEADPVYATGISFTNDMLDAGMNSGDGDNNDGVSVIDVTNPESPAYCFVSVTGTETEEKLPLRVPLTAEGYLRAYYPLPTPGEMGEPQTQQVEKYNVGAIAALNGEKMVTLEMLADAWPSEYMDNLKSISLGQRQLEPTPVKPTVIPPLSDLTVPPSVEAALDAGDTTQLEDILWMPNKMAQIQSTLREITPFPDSGISLLTKILAPEMKSSDGNAAVDLSGYSLLSSHIIKITSSFSAKMETLNLSYNKDITIDTVREVLTSCSLLKRLVLLGCTGITDDDVNELLNSHPKLFYNLEAFIHPFLLKDKSSYANAFSYIGVGEYNMITTCSLAYFSPPLVVQALTDIFRCFTAEDALSNGITQTCFAPQSAFSSAFDDKRSGHGNGRKTWGERSVVAFPQTSLGALKGEGWAFIFNNRMYGEGLVWGFARRLSKESEDGWMPPTKGGYSRSSMLTLSGGPPPPFEVLDLRSFLTRMVEEGRPVVEEEAIVELEGILKKVEEVTGAHLASSEDMALFIASAHRAMQR